MTETVCLTRSIWHFSGKFVGLYSTQVLSVLLSEALRERGGTSGEFLTGNIRSLKVVVSENPHSANEI